MKKQVDKTIEWEDYEVDIQVTLWKDSYGEDADGNRGMDIIDFDWDYSNVWSEFGTVILSKKDKVLLATYLEDYINKYAWEWYGEDYVDEGDMYG